MQNHKIGPLNSSEGTVRAVIAIIFAVAWPLNQWIGAWILRDVPPDNPIWNFFTSTMWNAVLAYPLAYVGARTYNNVRTGGNPNTSPQALEEIAGEVATLREQQSRSFEDRLVALESQRRRDGSSKRAA